MTGLAASLWPFGFGEEWRFVQGPENHDIVYVGREMRVARLGDPGDPRSWYGRSRARVATGIGLTAPGIPMLFMGQEFLEDKQWSDNFAYYQNLLLYWAGLDIGDKQMLDHLRFTRELIGLRWQYPGLRGQGFGVVHAHDDNRVLAFHRWVVAKGPAESLQLWDRLPGQRPVARGFQQRRLRELGESGRYRQWRRGVGGRGGDARIRPIGGAHAAGE